MCETVWVCGYVRECECVCVCVCVRERIYLRVLCVRIV